MGHMVLHHHAGGPCVDGCPPLPPPKGVYGLSCVSHGCSVDRIPLDSVSGVDIVTQHWAQCQEWRVWARRCCTTTRVGHASTEIARAPPQRCLLGLGTLLCCPRPGHQGGGGGLAAQGDMRMQGATNLVGEAAEASLAGPSMLER